MQRASEHEEREPEENIEESRIPFGEVERLVELLNESGVGEIRVKNGDFEVSVKARTEFSPAPPIENTAGAGRREESPSESSAAMNGLHAVKSPLVGTFYRAPAPGEDFFVEVGDRVKAGETLCIVEAMKLMNEIPADVSGEIVEILAENSSGVEYDEPLFHIKPE